MSEENWKLEKDLCRCCLSEGSFKNLAQPYLYQGEDEIYSDMLVESLDVNLTPVSGPLCSHTYTICDECILRLRDACIFKRQVLTSEKRFRDLYSRDVIQLHSSDLGVKEEAPDSDNEGSVKMEMDDDDFRLNYKDDEDGDNKSDIDLDLQAAKKAKPKKPKAKEKPKPKKRAGRPRKLKAEADGEADAETEAEAVPKEKKGKKMPDYYTVRGSLYECNDCGRTFASQPLVSQHYRFVHLKRRPRERKCPRCDKKIPDHLRAYHLEEAHGIPAPSCGVCGKKFRYPCHVVQHQRKVHMNEKNATCSVCSKEFFDELTLRSHMVTHESGRFECDLCGRQFRWKGNLKDHLLAHTDERRFVCPQCGKAFVQKSTLKQHAIRNHFNDVTRL